MDFQCCFLLLLWFVGWLLLSEYLGLQNNERRMIPLMRNNEPRDWRYFLRRTYPNTNSVRFDGILVVCLLAVTALMEPVAFWVLLVSVTVISTLIFLEII